MNEDQEIHYIHGGNTSKMIIIYNALRDILIMEDDKAKEMLQDLRQRQSELHDYLYSDEHKEKEGIK